MTLRLLACLVLTIITGSVSPSLKAQGQVTASSTTTISPETSATKSAENPAAATSLEAAQKLYLTGQFEKAVEQYQLLIRANSPDDAAAYAGMARAYLRLKKPDDAYTAASNAVRLNPSLPTAHSALGEVLFRQGQLYDAQEQFVLPFKTGQADARSYFGIEKLDRASFDYKRAKLAIDRAYALAPDDPEIFDAWIATRPLSERVKAMEALVDPPNPFYTRSEIADMKHHLAVLKDRLEHPERTCHLVNSDERSTLPLVRVGEFGIPDRFLGLEVNINGQGSPLVVDTSDDDIVINGKIAEKAHVQQIVRTDMEGLGEESPPESYIGFAKSVQIGKLEFENCYLTVIERASRGSFFDQLPGTIGARLFEDYLVDLDMPRAKLTLTPLPKIPSTPDPDSARANSQDPDAAQFHNRYISPEISTWTRIYQFGSDIAIPAAINESPTELFGIDTASYVNDMTRDFAQKWAAPDKNASTAPLYGTDGKVSTKWSGKVRLKFAGYYFDSRAEPSFDLKATNDRLGTELYGNLGFEVLQELRIEIDYRDGLIHFEYHPTPLP